MKKFRAFTLSEVLITLSIVGVVSVLTLPNVMASYQKRVQVAGLQRTYNMITTAIADYMNDNRKDDLAYTNLTTLEGVEDFFENYFNASIICSSERDDINSCVEEAYNKFHRDSTFSLIENMGDVVCANMNSGATVCFRAFDVDNNNIFVFIDTNGRQKPNVAGRDFFGLLPLWSDGKLVGVRYNTAAPCPISDQHTYPEVFFATPCFAKIQNEGWQMNY